MFKIKTYKTYKTYKIIIAVIGAVGYSVFFGNKGYCQVDSIQHSSNEIIVSEFQEILQKSNLKGSILIYNPKISKLYSNDFEWVKIGRLPASTFKIPNTIIALETGVVESDSTILKWNGKERERKIWEKDLTLKQAFHLSCVPCYQEIARKIGVRRMKQYTSTFQYGNLSINKNNLDKFWLEGNSTISQYQQIEFLKALYDKIIPISDHTSEIMKRIMVIDTINNYVLSGKTGWSIKNNNHNGWFVGYIEKPDHQLFFAVNVEPKDRTNTKKFYNARKQVLIDAIEVLERKTNSQNFIGDEREIQIILKNIKSFSEFYIAGNYDSLANMYCKDGMILPPGADIIKGREAIKQRWILPEGVIVPYHKITPSEISVKDNWAYDIGYYEGLSIKKNGDKVNFKGKYVIVWRKEDSDWKIYADAWNGIN